MEPSPDVSGQADAADHKKGGKLGTLTGVYIPVCLSILSILMFLRFGFILGRVGFLGILGLLLVAYSIEFLTIFSLSAIASNGEVKGGGPYYLISRSLGPEFGGSIGILFYIASVLNAALNVVGLIDCIRLNVGEGFPQGYWVGYGLQTAALLACTALCLLSSSMFTRASNSLLAILSLAVISIPASAIFLTPFNDEKIGLHFTGLSLETLAENFLPIPDTVYYTGFDTFRDLFGILFPATAGILAGASVSNDLKNPSRSIPKGTLWATLTTLIVYFVVALSMAASTTRASLLGNPNVIPLTNFSQSVIFAGECAVTCFSALMGLKSSTGLFRALAKDKLLPGLSVFGKGAGRRDFPFASLFITYAIAQVALLADLNQIATLISMGFQMTFFVLNLACFLLKIGGAPNFRPNFKFFNWQTACLGSLSSAAAMFFIDETNASLAICCLVFLFLLIHYLCPPKRWGDVSQNLIYHQVRKYLLRLRPEHIKFWRPHIILLINDPRKQTRLIQFCNSLKKGSLYILGHVIVTDDFNAGVYEARLQQQAWTNYISESSRIKAFMQLTMSPSLTWGVRNLILSAGLGGMRPNVAVLGFYNMDDLRKSNYRFVIPDIPTSPAMKMRNPPPKADMKRPMRRRVDTSARLIEGVLPTDVIKTEGMMKPTEYMTILEDLTLRHRMNVAVGYGFEGLETPHSDDNSKKYIDLWPIQMSAEVMSGGKNVLTTNFDTYTLILQLGHILHSVHNWRKVYTLRVMVFVEYENEVNEESARVRVLLEKLRIDAQVVVFWLASGHLNTYELIINGSSHDMDWDIIVNEALRDEEWWDDLQMFRGDDGHMSPSQERTHLAHIIDSTSGRRGVYNPHEELTSFRDHLDSTYLGHSQYRPNMAMLTRLGVNVGMHTHHLIDSVLKKPDSGIDPNDATVSSSDDESTPDGDDDEDERVLGNPRQPLLPAGWKQPGSDYEYSSENTRRRRRSRLPLGEMSASKYGSMSTSQTLAELGGMQQIPGADDEKTPKAFIGSGAGGGGDAGSQTPLPSLGKLSVSDPFAAYRARSMSPERARVTGTAGSAHRPGISRQSSGVRFSSRPVPETTVTTEGDDSRIAFAESGTTAPKVDRPHPSRQSSYNRGGFSSRPVPETKITGGDDATRTIKFADEPIYRSESAARRSASHSRQASRQPSRQGSVNISRQGSTVDMMGSEGDVNVSIPELLDSYRHGGSDGEQQQHTQPEGGSTYSTQSLALSFNDLPRRAQHLILNELMRQNSGDAAVIMTTLPVPSEQTSTDEADTMGYLSDVEVLCNELPPTLMVLSNSMTVTVSL
ncbi:solute carrier family 12 (potassium/chloride transporters), member 9 [Geosmithia morbida]|uniref:Solute carrier family 12 (Potassium/chloride transporters), member 9 n=1 Tax=Geosmithia morbida TaxID=1094350 RepID=A0A9P5CYU1_9HYPO|nr:solute carrier family 12 (potassium/chloride transporters), member 9 [Geosmithia morbida]KAF4120813.1 solute carrier family 12 (potassium/chloride transporters), member 9 [Geosmithia morbida]